MLHLITCHGRIMPRLAELLLSTGIVNFYLHVTMLWANSADDELMKFYDIS